MKTKVIKIKNNEEEWEHEINKFNAGHDVKATQTHVKICHGAHSYDVLYVAVLYYLNGE